MVNYIPREVTSRALRVCRRTLARLRACASRGGGSVTALARVRAGRSVHICKVSIRVATLILCLFGQMAES